MRFFALFTLSAFLSNRLIPIKLNESARSYPLICMSSLLSHMRLGDKLISTSHGLKSLSISISNPKSSKQFVLWMHVFLNWVKIWFSPARMLLIITS